MKRNLIPYEELSLKSPIKKDDLKLTLQFNLEWNEEFGMFFNKNSIKNYEGFLENDNFKLRRILKSGINSFIPLVSGRFIDNIDTTEIQIKIGLQRFVRIFLLIYFMFSISLFLANSCNDYKGIEIPESIDKELLKKAMGKEQYDKNFSTQQTTNFDWTGLFIIIISYAACMILFKFESSKAKDNLIYIFGISEHDEK